MGGLLVGAAGQGTSCWPMQGTQFYSRAFSPLRLGQHRTLSLFRLPDWELVDYSLPEPLAHILGQGGRIRNGRRLKDPFQKPHLAQKEGFPVPLISHPSLASNFILKD